MKVSLRRGALLAATAALAALLTGCVAPGYYYADRGYGYDYGDVERAPPPVRAEVYGVAPWPDALWIGGYWGWRGNGHYWVPGRWDHARPGYQWSPHRWDRGNRGWRESPGHWDRRGR